MTTRTANSPLIEARREQMFPTLEPAEIADPENAEQPDCGSLLTYF
ncbi:MAG: hypothetical protein ACREQQ_06210 [Candidatus Binatia bacterium]